MATLKHGGVVRTTLGAHGGYAMAADASKVTIGRVVRLLDGALAPLPCVSLRYYESCSCPDEATCPLRAVMIDVRDAMLEILDFETLAELAARDGQANIDPRNRHADALAGRRP
jgi:Rrf2 family protein